MGGGPSQQQDSSSASKKATLRQKFSFKRKPTFRDKTRPFRDLIKSWPISDLELLLEEFEANSKLLKLQKQCDLARKSRKSSFSIDFHREISNFSDLTLIFKNKSIQIDRNFVCQRCKNLKIPENSRIFEISSENFKIFSENEVETFLNDYLFTENSENLTNFQKLKTEFGCQRKLAEDTVQMWKNDLKSGDLVISVQKSNGNDGNEKSSPNNFEIRCSSSVAASRSPLIKSLLHRKITGNCEKPEKICFDEHIFPRAFAEVFVFFLYTDIIDWQLAQASEISVSSLSLAKAITSGRNPHVQLWKSLQIIQIARFFRVENMVRACEDVVVKNLSSENVVNVLQWSREHNEKFIESHAFRHLEREFSKIFTSNSLFDLEKQEMMDLTSSQFLQCTELELLETCVRWGEHALLKKLEDREPNILADTCHSISRRGVKRSEILQNSEELEQILKPLTSNIRKEYALPPFDKLLNEAYSRRILEQEPMRNLEISVENREINPDFHWIKMSDLSNGPRYFIPYHQVLNEKIPNGKREFRKFEIFLDFRNVLPEILQNEQFLMAQETIRRLVDEFEIEELPRLFHRISAVNMITRKVLTELDIAEECFECHVANGKPTNPPDVLPPPITGIYDIF